MHPLGHHQGMRTVGSEVQVVGIFHPDPCARSTRNGVDRHHVVAEVVIDPQRLQVPARHNVLGFATRGIRRDHPEGLGVDHLHRVRGVIRDVDQASGSPGSH